VENKLQQVTSLSLHRSIIHGRALQCITQQATPLKIILPPGNHHPRARALCSSNSHNLGLPNTAKAEFFSSSKDLVRMGLLITLPNGAPLQRKTLLRFTRTDQHSRTTSSERRRVVITHPSPGLAVPLLKNT